MAIVSYKVFLCDAVLNLGTTNSLLRIARAHTIVDLNPLRSNSDQRQISLCNINAFSVRDVMRIKNVITQHEFR